MAMERGPVAAIPSCSGYTLLEPLDDRVGTRATLITNQLPVSARRDCSNDPTLADAILDRFLHAAHRIPLKGESMRKKQDKPSVSTRS